MTGTGGTASTPSAAHPRWPPVLRWLRRGASLLILLALLDYVVLPQLAGASKSLRLLDTVNPWWVVGGVLLEAVSLASYSMLSRSILPGPPVRYSRLLRMDLTAIGLSHMLPAGAAAGNAFRFRVLRQSGSDEREAGVGLALEGIGSTVTLLTLLWIGLLAHIVVLGPTPSVLTASVVGAALVVALVVIARGRSRFAAPLSAFGRGVAIRLPQRLGVRLTRWVDEIAEDVDHLLSDYRALRACAVWSVINWLADAASLWMFLAAFGHTMNPVGLLVAYGIANAVATLPVTPGGLGLVEGAMIPSLVAYGAPAAVAVLAVVSWRLFQFWAPIPVAGVAYLSLRIPVRRQPRP